MKRYKFGLEYRGLILFPVVMLPVFIWSALPAPNDILRAESITEIADIIGSVYQVIMIAALCLLKRTDCRKFGFSPLVIGAVICCAAFLIFALDRKNYIAVVPVCVFIVCHSIYGVVNYIV